MRDAACNVRKYRKLKILQTKIQEDINFLKRCKSARVFPKFIKIRTSVSNRRSKKAEMKAKKVWLQSEINYKYAKMNEISMELYNSFGKILKEINPIFSEFLIEEINDIECTCNRIRYEKKFKLNRKFQDLSKKNCEHVQTLTAEEPNFVTNLSKENSQKLR